MSASQAVAVVAGASRGLGSALCSALVGRGFAVAALGREAALRAVADEVPAVTALACELANEAEVDRAFAAVEERHGPVSLVVYNAHRIELRSAADTSVAMFEDCWRASCLGAFVVARRALAGMVERRDGTLIFSGATGSVRGGKRSAAFAAAKFGLRGLAQSLAREYAAAGVHVAHVILDGLIWSERTRARFDPLEQTCMPAAAVAAEYLHLIGQERSAWTHELDLRPASGQF